ncbi:Rha family transcriptional regulator, partial [Escherichia coli]
MNTAIFNDKASMTSVEIAELVGSQHSDVKRSIERLVAKNIIRKPPMAVSEKINNLGF